MYSVLFAIDRSNAAFLFRQVILKKINKKTPYISDKSDYCRFMF